MSIQKMWLVKVFLADIPISFSDSSLFAHDSDSFATARACWLYDVKDLLILIISVSFKFLVILREYVGFRADIELLPVSSEHS